MRVLILMALPAALVTGCGSSNGGFEAACFAVAKQAERYPSTAALIDASSSTAATTPDEFANIIADGALTPVKFNELEVKAASAPAVSLPSIKSFPAGGQFEQASLLRTFVDAAGKAPRLGFEDVAIEYDIDNGNGVPERKHANCRFPLSDTASKQPLFPLEELARLEDLKRQRYGFERSIPNRAAGCCYPKFALVDPQIANVAGGVLMEVEISSQVRSAMQALRGERH